MALVLSVEVLAADTAIVTRRGGDFRGTVEGSVQVVGDGILVLDGQGAITGDLKVPAEKRSLQPGPVVATPAPVQSSRTTVEQRRGKAVQGSLVATDGFELPRVLASSKPVKPGSVQLDGSSDAVDYSTTGSLSLRGRQVNVALPGGVYGDISIFEGDLVLGQAGSAAETRYELRSLAVGKAGRLLIAGPVVIILAHGARWEGTIGDPDKPLALDIRVAQGDITLAGGALYGTLLAPRSTVTVAASSRLVGAVACDTLVVAPGGRVTATEPDWSPGAASATRPRFLHKALRVESRIPSLKAKFMHGFYPGLTFVEDVPMLMVAEGKRPVGHPSLALQEHAAVFESLRAVFLDSGFERAGVTLTSYSANPAVELPTVKNLVMPRAEFDALVRSVAGKADALESLNAIAGDRVALAEFARRTVSLGQP